MNFLPQRHRAHREPANQDDRGGAESGEWNFPPLRDSAVKIGFPSLCALCLCGKSMNEIPHHFESRSTCRQHLDINPRMTKTRRPYG